MKNLKQTKLSFATLPSKVNGTSGPAPDSGSASSHTVATSKPVSKVSTVPGRVKRVAMDCVEIPPPPKRHVRTKATPKQSNKSTSMKTVSSTQPRIPSLKRKSPVPESSVICHRGVVHVPSRIAIDSASCSVVPEDAPAGQLSRDGPLVPKDNNRVPDNEERGPPPPKKLRLSSPTSDLTPLPPSSVCDTDQDEQEFVPPSQSDEQELTIPRIPNKNPAAVKESVDRWRLETIDNFSNRAVSPTAFSPFSELSDIPTDLQDDPPPPSSIPETPVIEGPSAGLDYPHTPCSNKEESPQSQCAPPSPILATTSLARATQLSQSDGLSRDVLHSAIPRDTSPSNAFRSLTPPPSSDLDIEPDEIGSRTVQVLDVKTKTEQLIARIKARAYAAAHSSPEQSPLNLDALSDSDSDSSDDDNSCGGLVASLMNPTKGMGKAEGIQIPAKTGTSRYNLRRTSPSQKPKAQPSTPIAQSRKLRKADPLDLLLCEKLREERTGTGMAAIRKAEETLAEAKADLHSEMELEELGSGSDEEWDDLRAMAGPGKSKSKSKSPAALPSRIHSSSRRNESDSDDEHVLVAQKHSTKLLGEKDGQAVKKILENDMKEKLAKALAKESEEPLGVPLWPVINEAECDEATDVESSLPLFTADVTGNAVLQLLKSATERNDAPQVSALLSSGFVALLRPEHYTAVVPWLVDIAFSDVTMPLGTLAYTQLMRLAPLVSDRPSGLRLSCVLSVLVRLGVPPQSLEKYGLTAPSDDVPRTIRDVKLRDEMVYRLVSLVDAFAQSFVTEDLDKVLFVMVLIGMDPTMPENLQTETRKACNSLAHSISTAQAVGLEACKKIVALGKPLSPPNQALLVSFIPNISSSTTHLARLIARSLLLNTTPSQADYQQHLHDLLPLVKLLSPAPGSGEYFDITGHSDEEGYYDDLTCRLSLLSKALSDIDEYTIMEKRAERAARQRSLEGEDEEKEKETRSTILEHITRQLNMLHGRIIDTRAAHLDRSRAKAALQRLSFRVVYQRNATIKSGLISDRPKTILGFFAKPSRG